MEVIEDGLRVVGDFAMETGGVGVINVCLDIDEVPSYRLVALGRLFNPVNATASRERGYALPHLRPRVRGDGNPHL